MKTYELKLTGAIAIDGKVVRAGTKVSVDEPTAKDLLRRGKAEVLTAPQEDDDAELADVDLHKMTKDQLVEIATSMGVENPEKLNKAELVKAIEAADQDAE